MRYFYEKPKTYEPLYGRVIESPYDICKFCTIYEKDGKGLAVTQARFNPKIKIIFWGEVDPWLANDIYLNPNFKEFFNQNAAKDYPLYSVRKLMWALRMKPLPKEFWEEWK